MPSKRACCQDLFCEALIKAHPATFAEVRRLAVAHIADESEVAEKRGSVAPACLLYTSDAADE